MPDISRCKDNQIIKSDHLVRYDIRNIFLKNLEQNVVQ